VFDGRPVIGICQTHSDFTPCNGHFRELAEYVKRGVWEAGGFPLEFPCMSLGESLIRPTAMLFRNLMAMDVEESIRGYPMDGVVLLTGCDKTTPGPVRVYGCVVGHWNKELSVDCAAAHGRGELRAANNGGKRRPHVERQVQRPGHWFRHARVGIQ
jgi:hypothetical protein